MEATAVNAAPPFLSAGEGDHALPALRDLVALLDERRYGRMSAIPLPGTIADAVLDPVNVARALGGRSNLFHQSAAWRLYAAAVTRSDPELGELHQLWLLGRPAELGRARRLLGELVDPLLRAGVLEFDGERIRATVAVVPFNGRTFLADAFRYRDDPDYCYVGRATFTVPAFIRRRLSPPGPGGRLLDLGCGCGAGAIACGGGFEEVIGTDIVERCLRFARVNAALNGVQATFTYSDVFSHIEGTFDVVIANTPCVWDEVEPGTPRTYASGGSDFGLELPARMLAEGVERLRPGGTLAAVISAPLIAGRPLAISTLERICADRPAQVALYPLLQEYELRNLSLYRRHRISAIVRYLAVIRPARSLSITIAPLDRARAVSYRNRATCVRTVGRWLPSARRGS